MNEVHYPQNLNRYDESVTLCGQKIKKVTVHPYSKRLKQDSSKVSHSIDKVNCECCLLMRFQMIQEMSEKVIKRRFQLGHIK